MMEYVAEGGVRRRDWEGRGVKGRWRKSGVGKACHPSAQPWQQVTQLVSQGRGEPAGAEARESRGRVVRRKGDRLVILPVQL